MLWSGKGVFALCCVLLGLLLLAGCGLLPGGNEPEPVVPPPVRDAAAAVVPGGGLLVDAAAKLLPKGEPEATGLADWRERVDDCADEESDNFRRALDITDMEEVRRRCEVLLDVPCWATIGGCPK